MKYYTRWKFTILLIAIFLLMTARIVLAGVRDSQVVIDFVMALVVATGVLAACTHRNARVAALLFASPCLILTLIAQVDTAGMEPLTFVLLRATTALFLGYMTVTVVMELLHQREITRDTLAGAFCGYLMIAGAWTELYIWIELVNPGAFNIIDISETRGTITSTSFQPLQYFSFVTLTTVGYGDIVPVSPLARTVACLEAICGQFYLAILVAGLVSVRIAQLPGSGSPEP